MAPNHAESFETKRHLDMYKNGAATSWCCRIIRAFSIHRNAHSEGHSSAFVTENVSAPYP